MLGKLDGMEHLVEEKLVMECLLRELLNQYCLAKIIFLTLYVLRAQLLKAMALQGRPYQYVGFTQLSYIFQASKTRSIFLMNVFHAFYGELYI